MHFYCIQMKTFRWFETDKNYELKDAAEIQHVQHSFMAVGKTITSVIQAVK